jgi:hypothetical protein
MKPTKNRRENADRDVGVPGNIAAADSRKEWYSRQRGQELIIDISVR